MGAAGGGVGPRRGGRPSRARLLPPRRGPFGRRLCVFVCLRRRSLQTQQRARVQMGAGRKWAELAAQLGHPIAPKVLSVFERSARVLKAHRPEAAACAHSTYTHAHGRTRTQLCVRRLHALAVVHRCCICMCSPAEPTRWLVCGRLEMWEQLANDSQVAPNAPACVCVHRSIRMCKHLLRSWCACGRVRVCKRDGLRCIAWALPCFDAAAYRLESQRRQ